MEINIKTKFDIGDEVFFIEKRGNIKVFKKQCPACEGKGNVEHNGFKIFCSICGGRGICEEGKKVISKYSIGGCKKVTSMRLQIPGTNAEKADYIADIQYLRYKVDGRYFTENLLCATEEEAVIRCVELNDEYTWHNMTEIPKMGSIVVLLDKWGNENHSVIWIEGAYHTHIRNTEGGCVGIPVCVDNIIKWRYAGEE